ncbi:hypothetical protein [Kribbella sp. HUAS MG21]|uniref:Uncharacterized protein n=1 Tax=Kribbella sp. HUAS MG21 TaxID=3160966 RepID=A0AAU7TA59_9ACTN
MRIAEHRRTIALVLLAVALGLLVAGRFVSFDAGSLDWIFPLGPLAGIPAVTAVVVAWPEPKARLWLGIALAVLTAFIVWQSVVNVGFRFIWTSREAELPFFELLLFLLSCLMLATAGVALGAPRWLLRIPAYLIGVAVLSIVVAGITGWYYARTCADAEEGGCMAVLGALTWGAGVVVASPVVILVIEVILWRRRRRKAAEAGGG